MIISFLTFLCPIFGLFILICYLIKNWNLECNNIKKLVFPISIIFGSIGYSLNLPKNGTDLTNYFNLLDSWKGMSLGSIVNFDKEQLLTKDILFHIVNLTGDNHILPFIVGLLCYYIVFYIIFDRINRSSYTFKYYQILILSLISTGIIGPYFIICNVRCVFSFCIITLAIYRELIQKKKNLLTLLLYIIPLGLHSSAIIIIIIRILSSIFKNISKLSIIIPLLIPTFIDFLHSNVSIFGSNSISKIFVNAINKSYTYLYWTSGGFASSVDNSLMNKIVRVVGTIFLVSMITVIFKYNKKEKIINSPMISYLYYICLFTLGCLTIKTGAFWRFEAVAVLFSPILFISIIENNKKFNFVFIKYFLTISIIMIFINMYFMHKNIIPFDTFYSFICVNGIEIVFKIFNGIIKLFI